MAAATANAIHPVNNATPPSGVIAPSARTPVKVIAHSDPENSMVSATNAHPASRAAGDGERSAIHAAANSGSACYIR